MLKTMTALSIRPGTDADAFWRYHITRHADDSKGLGGKTRYLISRVAEAIAGNAGYFDMVEMWWPDRSAVVGRHDSALARAAMEDFRRHGGIYTYRTIVDEHVVRIGNESIPPRSPKALAAFRLEEGADPVAAWTFCTEDYAPAFVARAGSGLVGLSLNRRVETLVGKADYFALVESWWSSPAAHRTFARSGDVVDSVALRRHGLVPEYEVTLEEVEIALPH